MGMQVLFRRRTPLYGSIHAGTSVGKGVWHPVQRWAAVPEASKFRGQHDCRRTYTHARARATPARYVY